MNVAAYQDDYSHEHQIDEEVSWLTERRRCCLETAAIGVQEVRIQYQAKFRPREDESRDASPELWKRSQCEDIVFEEYEVVRADDAHPRRY